MADYVKLNGVAASDGVAVGPVFVHVPRELKPSVRASLRTRSRRNWGVSTAPSKP